MELDLKLVENFLFVKIGKAKIVDIPLKAKGISNDYKLALELINNELINAEQSAYLVYDDKELIYAGYYSGSFKARWLREQNKQYYFWHSDNVDNEVNKLLLDNKGKNITVWLSVNPYAKTEMNQIANISKVIEDKIIMKQQPRLNKVGKDLETNKKNTKSVIEILKINE